MSWSWFALAHVIVLFQKLLIRCRMFFHGNYPSNVQLGITNYFCNIPATRLCLEVMRYNYYHRFFVAALELGCQCCDCCILFFFLHANLIKYYVIAKYFNEIHIPSMALMRIKIDYDAIDGDLLK